MKAAKTFSTYLDALAAISEGVAIERTRLLAEDRARTARAKARAAKARLDAEIIEQDRRDKRQAALAARADRRDARRERKAAKRREQVLTRLGLPLE